MQYKIRIAYLITAYHDYQHLKRLIKALNDDNIYFFIHIDKKSLMPVNLDEFENIKFIKILRKSFSYAYKFTSYT